MTTLLVLLSHSIGRADERVQMVLDPYGGAHVTQASTKPYPRLVAEFERTQVLMFGISDWQEHHNEILIEIAEKTSGRVNVLILCNDMLQIKTATKWLLDSGLDCSHVYFCEIRLDTIWLRDFGPIFAQTERGAHVLDFFYEGTRPRDDRLPAAWAKRTNVKHVSVPWTIQGGNLMCNGQGLGLVSNRIFEDNHITFPQKHYGMNAETERRRIVVDAFVKSCNLSQLVVLEPLQSELTKHVDMFSTFLSPNDVLVAQLDARKDPVNAAILERNVQRLSKVQVGDKPLRVHRIQIPARENTSWSAYTNAIIVDDLVLMPIFRSDPPMLVAAAKASYARLLPEHTIETIDMTSMKELQGELHCLSLHIPNFVPVPDRIYPFANAVDAYYP
ncbi:agmatine deiminase family protein [Rubripirellula amarantea]|uniref:Peptidylarginine deiminase n=1 Tax=Rubripirellula amarantea TaxID=2527999 RepID=A0A5C5WXR8_9BACT|nr:agmatine deiminase family protein [Rubripirellula amarantea]MDA8745016.1 agmatine deiminase family protein [Rubripirellula amarantea]TWT55059.1 Peptidylarginine deiminase precursor [Rubripirellula amarantea]